MTVLCGKQTAANLQLHTIIIMGRTSLTCSTVGYTQRKRLGIQTYKTGDLLLALPEACSGCRNRASMQHNMGRRYNGDRAIYRSRPTRNVSSQIRLKTFVLRCQESGAGV